MEYRNTIKLEPHENEDSTKTNDRDKPSVKTKKSKRKSAGIDTSDYDKPDKRKKRKISILKIVDIILGFVIIALIVFLLSISVFQIKTISVVGSTVWDENTIKSKVIVQNDYKKNGIYQYLYRLVRPAKDIPFVESAKISFKSPSHIVITVREKKLLGRTQLADGKYVYFNDDGVIREISDKLIDGVMPANGLVINKPKVEDKLSVGNDCLATMLNIVKSLKKYNIKIDSLEFDNNTSVKVIIGNITVDFGKFSYINEKIMRLNIILPKLDGKTGVLHMENWNPDNRDIVFEIL
jgi:cell division protein FtsQ